MSNSRLLLFDIDGTLISSGGRGKNAMLAAIGALFGKTPENFSFKDFAGSTDPLIVRTLIQKNGIQSVDPDTTYEKVLPHYIAFLERELNDHPEPVKVLPGVKKLLDLLQSDRQCCLGLVTGNIAEGAKMKLQSAGLTDYFSIGAYGSDAANRNLLPPIAVERAARKFDRHFSPENIWVIGDTPRDIACAKANEFRSLAVATGGWSTAQLQTHQPDVTLPDLSDSQKVLQLLKN